MPSHRYEGTTIVYRTDEGLLDIDSADFEVNVGAESNRKQFRSFRLKRQMAGKSVPRILDNALHRDIILLLGSGASPNFVIY
jgi:hypothetical protein